MRRALAILLLGLSSLLATACAKDYPGPWVRPPATSSTKEGLPASEKHSVGRLDAGFSLFALGLVDVSFGALFTAAVIFSLLHRARARAAAAFNPVAPLANGPFVVAGVVELEPGTEGAPVSVGIDQTGTEYSHKNGWSQRWTEIYRRVNAYPFLIRRDDGVVVRVIPDQRVALHDTLSRVVRHNLTSRTRIAELTAGERVHVSGQLSLAPAAPGAVYRGGPTFPTLTPLGRMVISTEPPGDTESRRARSHVIWAIVIAFIWSFFALFGMWESHVLLFDGRTVKATPTETTSWRVWVKPKNQSGHWVIHYALRAQHTFKGGGRQTLEDECSYPVYKCVTEGRCGKIPFQMSDTMPSIHRIGADLEISPGWFAGSVFVLLTMFLSYWGGMVSTRPWYMQTRLMDVASGRLSQET